ncbi:MAG: cytochrome c oxidase accessory protein CcoG [Bacteroidetes bacterium]|nr:cytochrome c oxidase accessory protein CcoG [Bacteroidota bacterium]MBL0138985.1 cytochrome c oxidase accessory protein CcoG [Bacteroidota bacterium]
MSTQAVPGGTDDFRDSISTISKDGDRAWIYPKKPKGRHYSKRTIVSIVLLALMFGGPFMKISGHPLMLFNVLQRKFIVFGVPFWPQDFFLFVLAMLTFFVFIILFTAIFGRVWCGWACPQTIFMEMVFRKIEYAIEGDANQQRLLNKSPWTGEKIRKKVLKNLIFFLLAFLIANTFLAYIIGIDELKLLVTEGPGKHMGGFVALVIFTAVFYGVYVRFREQVCLIVCPYGRLQGVLLDRNSVVIAYDYVRGETRGRIQKSEERKIGDCIDCHQCVHVCPTGIDIRNGTQLECVNCTACIDACDDVMEKVGFKKGLIRYASENSIAKKEKFKITTRVVGYSIVLLILLTTLTTLLALRTEVESTILRTPGQMYQKMDGGKISNLYNIQLVNKTFHNLPIEIKLNYPAGEIKFVGPPPTVLNEDAVVEGVFFVILPQSEIVKVKTPVSINVISNGKVLKVVKTNFLGPNTN